VLDRQHQTDGLLPREVFTFDSEKNQYICPQNRYSSTAQHALTRRSTSIVQHLLIATHVPFAKNVRVAGNGAYRSRSKKTLDRKSEPSKLLKLFNTPAASEKK